MVYYTIQPILNRSRTKPKTKVIAKLLSTIVLKQINKVLRFTFHTQLEAVSFLVINSYLFNIAFVISGAPCSPDQWLCLNDTDKHICDKLRSNSWSGIKCRHFRTRKSLKVERCCKWWDRLAGCFNENKTVHWVWECSTRSCQSSPFHPFQKAAAHATVNVSLPFMYTLQVHPCRPLRKNVFAVTISDKKVVSPVVSKH